MNKKLIAKSAKIAAFVTTTAICGVLNSGDTTIHKAGRREVRDFINRMGAATEKQRDIERTREEFDSIIATNF